MIIDNFFSFHLVVMELCTVIELGYAPGIYIAKTEVEIFVKGHCFLGKGVVIKYWGDQGRR